MGFMCAYLKRETSTTSTGVITFLTLVKIFAKIEWKDTSKNEKILNFLVVVTDQRVPSVVQRDAGIQYAEVPIGS